MQTLVLTVIGDDRPGLVKALAEAVAAGGGNWERSQLAELAGKFAGVVVVTIDEADAPGLRDALGSVAGVLDVGVHEESSDGPGGSGPALTVDLLGNDRPGIVRDISGVLAEHGLSVDEMHTATREAPMAGGQLFEARIRAHAAAGSDPGVVRAALEALAQEILVDLTVETD